MKLLILLNILWAFYFKVHANDDSDNENSPVVKYTELGILPPKLTYFDDSDTILAVSSPVGSVYRSTDAGSSWHEISIIDPGQILSIHTSPADKFTAIALGQKHSHWITHNQGKSWLKFTSPEPASIALPISFHAVNAYKIIFHAESQCTTCSGTAYYTTDGFKSGMKRLKNSIYQCIWAKSTQVITIDSPIADDNRIYCIIRNKYSESLSTRRLIQSDDYFKTSHDSILLNGRPLLGIATIAVVQAYLVAAVKSEGTSELALFSTRNGKIWHRARVGDHRIEENSFTILESSNYTLQMDISSDVELGMGSLFSSDFEGRYFTQNVRYTNRDKYGFVDYEKIAANVQGIIIVNTVDNWENVKKHYFPLKHITTHISLDDGRTFHDLKVGKDSLHLHSTTEARNSGKVFSSPVPGIVLGVGNIGNYLLPYGQGDLWISENAGFTWSKALREPHIHRIGGYGTVLVAIRSSSTTSTVNYSLDHGRTWRVVDLDVRIKVHELSTASDSSSLKFLIVGTTGLFLNSKSYLISLDFSLLHERECKDDDIERWTPRQQQNGELTCIMGHKQWFYRRKATSICLIKNKRLIERVDHEACECQDQDFECDYGFHLNDEGVCKSDNVNNLIQENCQSPKDKFWGSSGYRLIPGNDCLRVRGKKYKDAKIEYSCGDLVHPTPYGGVTSTINVIDANKFLEYFYLERKAVSMGDDETVVMLTDNFIVHVSHDHGKTWNTPIEEPVLSIYVHQHFSDTVFFITTSKRVYYSHERCKDGTIHTFEAPTRINKEQIPILTFHPKQRDWLIWTGRENCDEVSVDDCHSVAHISKNGGREWKILLPMVRNCQYIYREKYRSSDEMIYCEQRKNEDPSLPFELIESEDRFKHRNVIMDNTLGFASMTDSEFVIIAQKSVNGSLMMSTTIDGRVTARAHFPPNFLVNHEQAYTLLSGTTHAIFLHVTVNGSNGLEYGSILKSNSNGTDFVISLNNVNRDDQGFVDFESTSLEGVSIANVVSNVDRIKSGQDEKKSIKTVITHNDGADWLPIKGPNNLDELQLHGFTERTGHSGIKISSATGIGLLVSNGNLGNYLDDISKSDTFISRDGGVTWNLARKGPHMWKFGDQGSIILLCPDRTPTKSVYYSVNEGQDWLEFEFSMTPVFINDVTSLPNDNSLQFLLWATSSDHRKIYTVNLDFSRLHERQCYLPPIQRQSFNSNASSDYFLWTPLHPDAPDDCLFGHVAEYIRKKPQSSCFNGPVIPPLHNIAKNCSCTRRDFECDFNFERANDGSCQLIPGLTILNPIESCFKNPDQIAYWDITGYRRIPLSTCSGGKELDMLGQSYPCPGHEKEYDLDLSQRSSKSPFNPFSLSFLILLLFIAFSLFIFRYLRYNFDFTQFGRIQLGDASSRFSRRNRQDHNHPGLDALHSLVRVVFILVPRLILQVVGSLGKHFPISKASWHGRSIPSYTRREDFISTLPSHEYTAVQSNTYDYDEYEYTDTDHLDDTLTACSNPEITSSDIPPTQSPLMHGPDNF